MTDTLVVLLAGQEIGQIRRHSRGRLIFTYDQAWRDLDDSYPLSLSMPVAAAEHGPDVVEAFLWGLLPDNEIVLQRWGSKFQVSSRNVFALMSHVGEDCAGAVQFVTPERLDTVRSGATDAVEWLSDDDVAARLRALREDHAAWRLPRDTGQFSLAGAQPKTALLLENGRWGIPTGRIPTTHILKPPTGQFDGHAENEHLCLGLARALGLPTATSRVIQFGEEIAIVVDRYDRIAAGNEIIRIHQEDFCQALGLMPTRKYQNENGPGVAAAVELLRTYSSASDEDVHSFLDAVAFNWLIGGPDAHSKNYSLLISGGPRVRLAPLYDIASVLPYDNVDLQKVKLSMKIGGEYRLRDIGLHEWQKLAREVRVDSDKLIERLRGMAEQLPDEVEAIRSRAHREGLKQPIIDRLAAALVERALACEKVLAMGGGGSGAKVVELSRELFDGDKGVDLELPTRHSDRPPPNFEES